MRRFLQWLQPAGAYAWRWLSGMPAPGTPRPDEERFVPRHRALPPDTAPPPSRNIVTEIVWDWREIRAEWNQLRVRRALGREFREVERQVLAQDDADEP